MLASYMIHVGQHCLVGIKSYEIVQKKIFEILLVNIFRLDQYIYWVDAKVSADFFSFLCFKFLLKQNTINQQRIYHCYL